MYILGISGSPRLEGNTDLLLENSLEGARSRGAETEKVILNNLKFSPCQECADMLNNGNCKVKDDIQQVYQKVLKADAVIIASPIFFGSLSAQTKMMIDRFQCAWRGKYLFNTDIFASKKRIGAFISVEASERQDFFDNAKAVIKNFFSVINAVYKEEFFCAGLDEKGSVLRHADFLKQAFELGLRIC
ncbi:MAG: NADPH-dependent FMN reductase [Candidatus Omnitrophica bacterium CG11_big_fil_rev_8_21_14_0_20_42_13]|uniref:NADPH-dependent FMN reductase n=1 Tax=Candidatus Ghiorseimicrobium undicola TaxID=1974746 RepID=A0A2H0LXG1_9BACT|nr:MAG: NADPH-dependent FMN reductase [Candidatus Omnitrophica bacterium CG11_big_fil_rev_8_21_14_0_20_42_13]